MDVCFVVNYIRDRECTITSWDIRLFMHACMCICMCVYAYMRSTQANASYAQLPGAACVRGALNTVGGSISLSSPMTTLELAEKRLVRDLAKLVL